MRTTPLIFLVACGPGGPADHTGGPGSPLDLPLDRPLPDTLWGLDYRGASDTLPYAPVWPLWSNGLEKDRWVYLPPGTLIDTSTEDWGFPPGSALFKDFRAGEVLVETRVIRRTADDWEYATYLWEGDDTALVDPWTNVVVDWIDGVEHTVPTTLECRTCHEPGGGVLGLRAIQLSDADATALAAIAEPAPEPAPVDGPDPLTTEVLGTFVGNCVHCHDGEAGDQHSFDLRPEVAVENVVEVRTDANATAPGIRVVPGDPASSILFLAVSGEHDDPEIRSMPPLGVQQRDTEVIERLRTWIEQL